MRTKRLTMLSILLAISIVLSIVESLLPALPVPGVKLGLANVVTLLILYKYGEKDAFTVLLLRIILVGLLRGTIFNVTFYLSLSGGMVAYILMFVFKQLQIFSIIGVSIIGAFGHSVGQIVMAMILLNTKELIIYFPYIAILSIITGVLTGIIAMRSEAILKQV